MFGILNKTKFIIYRINKNGTMLFYMGNKNPKTPVWTTKQSKANEYTKKEIKTFKNDLKTKRNPLNVKIKKI